MRNVARVAATAFACSILALSLVPAQSAGVSLGGHTVGTSAIGCCRSAA